MLAERRRRDRRKHITGGINIMAIATSIPTAPFRTTTTSTPDLAALSRRIAGDLITRDDSGYDEARTVQIAQYNRKPLAIVRAACTADVVEAVRFARRNGLPMTVRSGGHSVPGLSAADDALMVDLSAMKAVKIDPVRGTARVQAGATSGDVAGPAHEHGLALTTGDTSTVGIGGLATGGGIGFLARKYGLTIDHLLSAEVVTATGAVVTASPTMHPDLFWAIRGGGGNFGIVTEFEFQLDRVDNVLAGAIVFPATREVVRGYLEYMDGAPEGLTTLADIMLAPPAPFIPEDRVGTPVVYILTIWTGDDDEGEKALAPLRALGEPIADTVETMPYPAVYEYTAELRERHGVAVRSMFSNQFSDDAIDASLDAIQNATSPVALVHIRGQGGAIARVPADATAFAHRTQKYFISAIAVWMPDDTEYRKHEAWADELWAKIRPEGNGVYVNFLQNEGEERIREAYPAATMDRLREVKRRYDPENVFCYNQNIKP
jgi:FAD/FMN-containing dehydrogenase